MNTTNNLFTIGHSNQTLDDFIALLKIHKVNCIVDVRSFPVSRYCSQFNGPYLKQVLKSHSIAYVHMGDEFGARRIDSIGEDGIVDFEQAVKTKQFLSGVKRINVGIQKGYCISFMCSEANPIECHRFALVSRYFYEHGYIINHILKDSSIISHKELEENMIKEYDSQGKFKYTSNDLFHFYSIEEKRAEAYRIKNKEIGYKSTDNLEL